MPLVVLGREDSFLLHADMEEVTVIHDQISVPFLSFTKESGHDCWRKKWISIEMRINYVPTGCPKGSGNAGRQPSAHLNDELRQGPEVLVYSYNSVSAPFNQRIALVYELFKTEKYPAPAKFQSRTSGTVDRICTGNGFFDLRNVNAWFSHLPVNGTILSFDGTDVGHSTVPVYTTVFDTRRKNYGLTVTVPYFFFLNIKTVRLRVVPVPYTVYTIEIIATSKVPKVAGDDPKH
ncbi:hypothetical protein K435DRAFT_791373 [Dendrothele bispora CBS 962.96]|uniref:Uncharacterized protein n=1 Tax=Dendrothele bispora (strain CBS 962.96) TaxID=1314807 RepID=A0A4S8MM83_DENBC|nr:hypothetical protein K435DRAFT_791373 [Dendrothele bispora CBS 962.96]